jgi:hypothetical protein
MEDLRKAGKDKTATGNKIKNQVTFCRYLVPYKPTTHSTNLPVQTWILAMLFRIYDNNGPGSCRAFVHTIWEATRERDTGIIFFEDK